MVDKTLTPSLWATMMDYPKMDLLLKIPFRMSTIERTELIYTYVTCTYLVYFCLQGHVQLNSGIASVSLHLHEVIGHQNSYQKLTFLKWDGLDLNFRLDPRGLKWVFRLK